MAHLNPKKIRVVQVDPETRDAVTTEFDTLEDLVTWAQNEIKERDRIKIEVKSEE